MLLLILYFIWIQRILFKIKKKNPGLWLLPLPVKFKSNNTDNSSPIFIKCLLVQLIRAKVISIILVAILILYLCIPYFRENTSNLAYRAKLHSFHYITGCVQLPDMPRMKTERSDAFSQLLFRAKNDWEENRFYFWYDLEYLNINCSSCILQAFAKEGAKVIATDISESKLQELGKYPGKWPYNRH